ncbi:MAG: 4-alpha-glucanotransferase [Clostridia bacterium]|nr:4-alpha-glucanotransferase [Clostridia bacterium]
MKETRTAGVLMHITSLPGPFGVGVLGQEAVAFAKQLAEMHFHYWQVLPLCPVDDTGSPYCSLSAFAGNIALIDPRLLERDGLLTAGEVHGCEYDGSIYIASHRFAFQTRLAALKKAFARLDDAMKEQLSLFAAQNDWVRDYALFMALKDQNAQKPWWEWPAREARYETAKVLAAQYQNDVDFYIFTQYVFFTQYRTMKEAANAQGVFLIGDMPIYVSRDSVDVWSNPKLFELDAETLSPARVAGVPPDYFSADGQLWGNPLYDWKAMKKDGYQWWIKRIAHAMKLFDRVRIDHFRAFASYWAIPGDSETAKVGAWETGPGMALFKAVKKALPDADVIAEDLGVFGEDVVQLLKDSGFPGMRVLQFGFDPFGDSTHLPHNYPKNCIAYLGTHDNNTLLGWLWDAAPDERAFALRYCCFGGREWGEGGFHSGSCRAMIEAVWRSSADTAVIAVQDMCGFGKDARMNIPGTSEENWTFRISADALSMIDNAYFKEINDLYRRSYSPERTV